MCYHQTQCFYSAGRSTKSLRPLPPQNKKAAEATYLFCGGSGIRTHGPRKESLVFKTSAFDQLSHPSVYLIVRDTVAFFLFLNKLRPR